MSWGRGGAGNIAQVEEANKRAAEDLEASQHAASNALNPSTSPSPSPLSTAPTQQSTASTSHAAAQPPQEYAHMGRGGAGNYYSPASLAATGTFSAPSATETATAEPVRERDHGAAGAAGATTTATGDASVPIARTGRGGAGNFVWAEPEKQQGTQDVEMGEMRGKEERVREMVESDVERGLSKPPSAFLGSGKEMDRFAEGH